MVEHYIASCVGKKGFKSHTRALNFMATNRNVLTEFECLHPYQCQYCHKFHIGHYTPGRPNHVEKPDPIPAMLEEERQLLISKLRAGKDSQKVNARISRINALIKKRNSGRIADKTTEITRGKTMINIDIFLENLLNDYGKALADQDALIRHQASIEDKQCELMLKSRDNDKALQIVNQTVNGLLEKLSTRLREIKIKEQRA